MNAYTKAKLLNWLGSPKVTVYCLAFLAVLTFVGTLYQVEHGLFEAQAVYYHSWFVMIGGVVPFPGAMLVMTVLFINLLGYFILVFSAETSKFGMLLVHLGILMLLVGGFINHYHARESFLSLYEGEASNVSASYTDWEISIWQETGPQRNVVGVDTKSFQNGTTFNFQPPTSNVQEESGHAPWTITIGQYHPNCRAFLGEGDESQFHNGAGIQRFQEIPGSKKPEENLPGVIFELSADGYEGKPLLLWGGDTRPTVIEVGGEEYNVALRRKRSPLPLLVRLIDFQREMHPGTETPAAFSSDVMIQNVEGVERQVHISMNEPMRYAGYTFFQASYSEDERGVQSSTFAVVRNYGRLVPYFATGITVVGMIFHFLYMLFTGIRKRKS